jgi:hypothetical protein
MQLIVLPTGQIRCLYDEAIDLAAIGHPVITRASHVGPMPRANGGLICPR